MSTALPTPASLSAFVRARSVLAVSAFTAGWRGVIGKRHLGTPLSDNRSDERASNVTELREGIASAADTASDLAGKAQAAAAQAGSTIREAAVETSKQASDAAGKVYQQGAQAADYVSRTTADQPLTALLIAGAIGYVVAYLIPWPLTAPAQRIAEPPTKG